MTRRRMLIITLPLGLTATVAGCAPTESPERQTGELVEEVTFAAVAETRDIECPEDDPSAYDTPWPGPDGAAECTFIVPDEQFTVISGEVEFLVPDGDPDSPHKSLSLTLNEADAAATSELTKALVEREQPKNQFAIIVDNEIISRPTAMEPLTDNVILIISGNEMEPLYDKLVGE